MGEAAERIAVVTGSNKGIGFEIVKQLASTGIKVVLTARDEKRGLQALETLKALGLTDFVVFHQLDVADAASVAALADFVKSQFGKLDILVNNAGISGTVINDKGLATLLIANHGALSEDEKKKAVTQTYELAEECLKINYYGTKITTESLLPLLKLSDSPRIVNVSSTLGKLGVGLATTRPTGISSNKRGSVRDKLSVFTIPLKSYSCQIQSLKNEWTKKVFSDVDNLTEDKVDEVLKKFLEDFKEGSLGSKNWPKTGGAYVLSKAAMNAYTRIVAKNFPTLCINSICPGYVITDITGNTGTLTAEEGAASVVKLALLSNGSPSGQFYYRTKVSSF